MSQKRSLLIAIALVAFFAASLPSRAQQAHTDCGPCHQNHGGTQRFALLRGSTADGLCLGCHGPGAAAGTAADIARAPKLLVDARTARSQHLWPDASRWRLSKKGSKEEFFTGACLQCHESHARSWKAAGVAKTLKGPGYTPEGKPMAGTVTRAADLCFKCHGQEMWTSGDTLRVGGLFSSAAASSHRLGATSRPDLPSLRGAGAIPPLDCISCHGSGDGLRGPHVSSFPKLLSDSYNAQSGSAESSFTYALCYGCHDRSSILGNESFPLHREHVTGQFMGAAMSLQRGGRPIASRGAFSPFGATPPLGQPRPSPRIAPSVGGGGIARPSSCNACHDPHGSRDSRALIRFDPVEVTANRQGQLQFLSGGTGMGSCSLACHGHDHTDARY